MEEKDWLPPDDEYDALNDETFGDDGDAEEFNWESAQAMINDFEKLKPNGKTQSNSNPSKGFSHLELSDSFDRDLDRVADDFDNENALEESISRLVMDDFDENDEEAEARKNKLRRLGGTGASMNTYFMPPQVVNKHLQWFMDKELPGGSSLLGSSVWSMHPTSTPADIQPSTSHHHQQHHHQSNAPKAHHNLHHVPDPRLLASSSHAVLQKLSGSKGPSNFNHAMMVGTKPTSSTGLPQKPIFKTVEEIERELMEGSGEAASNDIDTNNTTQKLATTITNHRPRVMTAEELERELMDDTSRSSPPKHQLINRDQHLPTSPMKPNIIQNSRSSPIDNNLNTIQGMSRIVQKQMSVGSPGRPPPGIINMNSPMMMQRMSHPPPPPQHMAQNQAAFAQRMMANAQMQHQAAVQFAFQQQQQHMRMMMSPQMRGRGPMMPLPPPMGHPGFPMHPNHQGPPHPQFMRQFHNQDPYRGLMNEKDKQRLRNIQIIQLQNDHPYTTDYYSLMFRVRHGSSDPKRQRDCLLKLYPRKCESSSRNNYQPAHFENSLGKLQAVSALAPKKAIDTVIRVVDAGPSNRGGMKAYRYLLLEIENLYECLLKIQEGDIRKTLLNNADDYTLEQRNKNEIRVKEVLEPQNKLAEILSVHKGKMLVSRLMPLMDRPFRFHLLSHMIQNFADWGASKNSEIDKTYPFLRHCIFSAEMPNIIFTFNGRVSATVYECMLTSKLGISLLMAVFHRAERLIQDSPPGDDNIDYLNRMYLKETSLLVQTLLSNVHTLAMPIEFPGTILKHFARWGYLPEDDLQQLGSTLVLWDKHSIPVLH